MSFAVCVSTSGVIVKPQLEITCAALAAVVPMIAAGAVHREVDARVEHAGRGQRHDRDEGFGEHAAIADQPHVRFLLDHLGRRARGDQRMEAGHRAAGDGDEQEWEQRAGEHRAAAVDEARRRRHRQLRRDVVDADRPAPRSCRS